jgi:RimJ/RimL family protein N-acetyltransferase
MPDYRIFPLTNDQALKIVTWQYDPPYEIYSLAPEDLNGLLNPDYRYHQVLDEQDSLVGYCCFGLDAQVPGGEYSRGEPEVLDVGVGLAPKLTGQGLGVGFVTAILDYAWKTYLPAIFRVTIADFNGRSLQTFLNLGFEVTGHFIREMGKMPFTQLERKAYD